MDVRRAPGIGCRPEGTETVTACSIHRHAAETLEGRVGTPAIPRVVVVALLIALPDLDHGTAHRSAAPAQPVASDKPVPVENRPVDDDTVELSPFEVTATQDTGYQATETLAGTRIRTNLKDVGSAISVVTKEFMKDIGATDNARQARVRSARSRCCRVPTRSVPAVSTR